MGLIDKENFQKINIIFKLAPIGRTLYFWTVSNAFHYKRVIRFLQHLYSYINVLWFIFIASKDVL